ncbi:hypothetical protein ES702_03988 [subsurface metagenome]
MGFLTDLWNQISEFLGIELVESLVPETKEPPKPLEPKETETPLPEKTETIAPIEEIEALPIIDIVDPTLIGEQGRANRIEVLPAKEEAVIPPKKGELPFTFKGVPSVAPLYEYTLTISGGKPHSQAIPYYMHENKWLPMFDPNVIPYIMLDAKGEAVYIFKGDVSFLTAPIKVLGESA